MVQHQLDERARKMLECLTDMLCADRETVSEMYTFNPEGVKVAMENGEQWGRAPWQDFEFVIDVPDAKKDRKYYLYLTTGREGQWDALNPQFLAKLDGVAMQAFDVNHTRMPFDKAGKYTLELKGYCAPQELKAPRPFICAYLCEVNTELEQLVFDLKVPYEAAILLPVGDRDRETTLEAISRAIDMLDQRAPHSEAFDASVKAAREYMQKEFYARRATLEPIAYADCVGHTHIDVAWQWDLFQTRHKAVRSFSTVCSLMDRYPEYKFMSSQPQLYDYVKQDQPELFERIRQRVAEGRWEVEGGMWVEADCNLTGGEAMARQFLYGQRFFTEEFGKKCRILWLPDVFGYSAALPQLMKLCDIDYFMTTKISWNEYNLVPYDTFNWKGIDGTKVLTHFSPSREFVDNFQEEGHDGLTHYTTYNALINPSQMAGGWNRYQQKGLDDRFLVSFGYGDGGGGPTDWMLENARRMNVALPNTPVVKMEHSRPFFEKLDERVSADPRLPEWSGELYLEYHRGTYTSQGHNKRNNRKSEIGIRSAELRSVQALPKGVAYPKKTFDEIWKDVLTLQFHDILPGSSIRKVYEDSDKMYAECFDKLDGIMQTAEGAMDTAKVGGLAVYNDLSQVRDDIISFKSDKPVNSLINADGEKFAAQKLGDEYVAYVKGMPQLSASNFTMSEEACEGAKVCMDKNGFETPFYIGKFDAAMRIVSLIDKRTGRELCKQGKALNRIVCYENRPHNYDAWDINIYYNRRGWDIDNVVSVEPLGCGSVAAGVRVTWKFMSSTITQDIVVYAEDPRIDFKTRAHWVEQTYVLKAHFPLDVFYNEVTCDIQYGNVRRATCKNTSWDVARFEICAHKWVDVSENGYGVALLNDCKYGHSATDDEIALTLLKTSKSPDELADVGDHEFNYALLPHIGGWREGNVVDGAYKFNIPAEVLTDTLSAQTKPVVELEGEGTVIEAVKNAEDNSGTIVRLYECFGGRREVALKVGFPFSKAEIVNILEEKQGDAVVEDGKIKLSLKPYQIVTVKLS